MSAALAQLGDRDSRGHRASAVPEVLSLCSRLALAAFFVSIAVTLELAAVYFE